MGKIVQINVEETERWNECVCSFHDYDVFYLNEYVRAFMNENKKNGIPILLYYENGIERAINVVFRRDVALDPKMQGKLEAGKFFDLTSPYGYGGFWGEIYDFEDLNNTYNSFCASQHYVCEFVRFELFSSYRKRYDGKVETRTHNVVRNLEIPLEQIWMDFKQKVRKNVKKANSNELEIVVENTGLYFQDFLNIYYSTMDRSCAEQEYYFSKEFFDIINSMRNNIMYFHVKYKEKIISTELVIYGAENCYSYLGGTYKEYFELRPNDFLKFEIIKWAKEKGLKNFILGGGYGKDDGIFQYKSCFAPKGIIDFYIGKKIFDYDMYKSLLKIRLVDDFECNKSNYFPQYRA